MKGLSKLADIKKRKILFPVILILVCVACCFLPGMIAKSQPSEDYRKEMERVVDLIDKEKYDEALERLDQLDDTYGVSDTSLYGRADICLALGNTEEARSYLEQVSDPHSNDAYYRMESSYLLEGTDQAKEKLAQLYIQAAEDLPEDPYMLYMAALAELQNGSTQKASYDFARVRELDETCGTACYYLGIIAYEQGDYEQAAHYFGEALERGVSEETGQDIHWYVNQILERTDTKGGE